MVEMEIDEAKVSDMEHRVDEFEIAARSTDGAMDQKETEWTNPNWTRYWGYFNFVPDLKAALLLKVIWDVGKGYTAEEPYKTQMDNISGIGKDSFDDLLFNAVVIARINGDSYAEIIEDDDGHLINLKPLDPGTMKTIVNRQGIIIRYEQTAKIGEKKTHTRWDPSKIFHLMNNRLADQIHGISDIESMEKTILANEENFDDMKKIMHRMARPMIMFKLGTDNDTKINTFVVKMDKAINKGENIYIPDDENAVSWEEVKVNPSSIIMEWRNDIRNRFYRNIGLPQVVPGAGGQSTESESKVIYLAFEQLVERAQRYIEKQVWNQLALKIDLIPPASIKQEMQKDEAKDVGQLGLQPGETTAGVGE